MTLDPREVTRRLGELSRLYVAETVEEGRLRLRKDAFSPEGVARRLEELRALDDMTRYLHLHQR